MDKLDVRFLRPNTDVPSPMSDDYFVQYLENNPVISSPAKEGADSSTAPSNPPTASKNKN